MFSIFLPYLANACTIANATSGILAAYFFFSGHPLIGILFFVSGQIFDLFDGKLARRFWSTRRWALYDDIADGITFGLVPGVILMMILDFSFSGLILGSLYTMSVFYRLWRFLIHDTINSTIPAWYFSGLPSPAGALIVMSLALTHVSEWILMLMTSIALLLMISRLHFRHFGKARLSMYIYIILGVLALSGLSISISIEQISILWYMGLLFSWLYLIWWYRVKEE